ncbi:putative sporulation protein YkwD [Gottschalkia acidurici 9a]|uniref:Sporulation protein YkwD n=1 Tax=Gottschalkia acidurici (strain ATCC 7906 / DSM 604 / BCRC 14475 / CIP 104303 / KCTC 5404 / NCIMB 10678 / 9a) TaxID=1128398 RepID=K0AXD8_GOTA9|nr:CAP domain-containing protein [Gottschalkia acidurici]AFS77422.1 putative sporulation protein YkwD [Gottschalkia acidurici 9a]
MKNSIKKISISLMAGTVILGSVGSVNAQTLNYNTKCDISKLPSNNKFVYYLKNNKNDNCPNKTPNKPNTNDQNQKPSKPNTNDQNQKPCKPNTNDQAQKPSKPDTSDQTQKPNKPDTNDQTQKPSKPDTSTPTENNQDQSTPSNVSSIESEVVRLVNVERSKQGLAPLKMSAELSKVARTKSQDMADKNYFSHTSPTYGSPFDMMKQFGIKYNTAGENIAKGYDSAQSVVTGWMNSPGHRANILSSNFGTIGVGYVEKNGTTYWTQMFTN